MGDNNEGFQVLAYMNEACVSPVGNLWHKCEKNEKRYLRICQHLGMQHFEKSWLFFWFAGR